MKEEDIHDSNSEIMNTKTNKLPKMKIPLLPIPNNNSRDPIEGRRQHTPLQGESPSINNNNIDRLNIKQPLDIVRDKVPNVTRDDRDMMKPIPISSIYQPYNYTMQSNNPTNRDTNSRYSYTSDNGEKTDPEREKILAHFIDEELNRSNIYSKLDKDSVVFQEDSKNEDTKYFGRFLFHNKNIHLLSYSCMYSADKKYYEITFLNFQDSLLRDKMMQFLETLKLANLPDVRRTHKFIRDDSTDKMRVVLIDQYQPSINLSDLINYTQEHPEIVNKMRQKEFVFKVMTTVWDTIRLFRAKHLKDLGLSSNLIILLERRTTQIPIKDEVVKMKRFFKDPAVVIDYKMSHFLRLILSEEKKKNAITITDLGLINFIPKFMIEAISKYKIDYNDEISFAIIIIQLMTGKSCDSLAEHIDFGKKCISRELENLIGDKWFVDKITECLQASNNKDINEFQYDFFSEKNKDFMALSRFLNCELDGEPINLSEISPIILESGLGLIDKSKFIRIMANSNYEDSNTDQIRVMCRFLLDQNFLHYAFVFIKHHFTKFEIYSEIYNVFPFVFFMLERMIKDPNIPYEIKLSKLHTEDLKQILCISPHFLFHTRFSSM